MKRLYSEELHSLYRSANRVRVIKTRILAWAGYVEETFRKALAMMGRNIRMYLKEIGVNTPKCVYLAQDRNYWRALVNAAFNLRVS